MTYEIELPFRTPLIYKWVDTTPIFTDVVHLMMEEGNVWYRVVKRQGEDSYKIWTYKTAVLQFESDEEAALFKLRYL